MYHLTRFSNDRSYKLRGDPRQQADFQRLTGLLSSVKKKFADEGERTIFSEDTCRDHLLLKIGRARHEGFEPPTPGSGGLCSIQTELMAHDVRHYSTEAHCYVSTVFIPMKVCPGALDNRSCLTWKPWLSRILRWVCSLTQLAA